MRGTLTKPAEQPISAPPGKVELRHRLQPAFGDGARAIGDAPAAAQHRLDQRMMLEALELHVGKEMRVLVVQMNDEADRHQIVLEMVHEASRRRS